MGSLIGSTFKNDQAAAFNGTNQYAYIDNPSFIGDTQGAFLFRVRQAVALSSQAAEVILSVRDSNIANNQLLNISQRYRTLGPVEGLDITTRRTNGGGVSGTVGNTPFVANTWMSGVVQSNGTAWSIYFDAVAQTLTDWTTVDGANPGHWLGDIAGATKRLQFSITSMDTVWTNQRLNQVLYVNRPLTGAEVTEWHNGGDMLNPNRLSFRPDIVSWWQMGEPPDVAATTIFDRIGSNHLTTVNTPTFVAYP